jgi:4-hydroxy-3-polyprenylbenzoate decarboxylase
MPIVGHHDGVLRTFAPHPRLLLATIRKEKAGQARATMRELWRAGVPESTIIAIFDEDVDVADPSAALFHATANLDPARDLVRDGPRLGVDATVKMEDEGARPWPPIIRMDDATKRKVDARWAEYGLP